MAKAQNEAWGLGYIDLYLIHFPIALKYVDPETLRYPVSVMRTVPLPDPVMFSTGTVESTNVEP